MPRRIGIIGDVHGCISELKALLDILDREQLDTLYHLGDLVDRGPDSGAVVSELRRRGITGVMGNHESKILRQRHKPREGLTVESRNTLISVESDPLNWDYLAAQPSLHVVDDVLDKPVILVHGGLWPGLPLYRQPPAVLFAQLINAHKPGDTAWYTDRGAQVRGLKPWQELWDGEEWVVYGHSVFPRPAQIGHTLGIDTGCVFGGALTALILPDWRFVSVPATQAYAFREPLFQMSFNSAMPTIIDN